MSDLSTVASLLKDTNKKLDKLHSDNEQNDTPADIIKGAIPEILADTLNTQRNIDSINDRQKDENKNDDEQMKADQVASDKQLKILGEIKNPMVDLSEIKKPMVDLGLAIPKSGFNAFSKKANDISAEKALPSDFKLMLQALTPKALTEGFKIGLGDMFKELGGGIKKIGSGIKSLGSKGLTAAQRKSEEKEKESKENKKDSFLKKTFGGVLNLLGNIWKTAKLAGKAGFLALLGAGAIYALAKLIESPYWNTVASNIEWGLNKIKKLFEFMDEQFGVGGVIATALALWYGTGGIFTLAGMAVKALGKKFLGKLGLTAATKGATTALGATGPKGLGLIGKLGLLGLALAVAGTAIYVLGEELEKFRKKAADKRAKEIDKEVKTALDPKTTQAERQAITDKLDQETKLAALKQLNEGSANKQRMEQAAAAAEKVKAAQAAALRKTQSARDAAVFGGTPKQISENLAKLFKDAIGSTTFKGNAKERLGQVEGLIGGISTRLLTSKSFQDLEIKKQAEFVKKLGGAERGAFNMIKGSGAIARMSLGGRGSLARLGLSKDHEKEFMLGFTKMRKEMRQLRKSQIKDPSSILPELNDELKNNTEQLKKLNDAKNGDKGDTNVNVVNQTGGSKANITMPPAVNLNKSPNTGQMGIYAPGLGY
jgi:hypothetical protein